MPLTAKVFINGRSQAVRLPAQFRFEEKEVYIRKDAETGDVILSRRPENWDGFFAALKQVEIPEDFLDSSDRKTLPQERNLFDDWGEE